MISEDTNAKISFFFGFQRQTTNIDSSFNEGDKSWVYIMNDSLFRKEKKNTGFNNHRVQTFRKYI